jgi:hypothetical protein
MPTSPRLSLDLGKKRRGSSGQDREKTDDSERHPQARAFPWMPPNHGCDPAPMDEEVDCQARQEGHRNPEVDLPPTVAVELPEGRVATAPGWKYVAEQHARGSEQHEGSEGDRIDRKVQGGALHA